MHQMDEKLQILRELYGEGEDREVVRQRLQEDPALWEEYQALSEAKFLLDHLNLGSEVLFATLDVVADAVGG